MNVQREARTACTVTDTFENVFNDVFFLFFFSAQHEGQTACTTTDKWESFALTSQRVDSWVSDKCVSVSQNKVVRSHHKKRPEDLLKNLQ